MKNLIKLFLLLAVASGLHAEILRNWIPIQDNKTSGLVYLDINSVVYFQKEIVQAQFMANTDIKQINQVKNGKSSITTVEIDCTKKTKYRILSIQWFEQNFAKGKFSDEKINSNTWISPPYSTGPNLAIRNLCQ
jgi:hypothetical protein